MSHLIWFYTNEKSDSHACVLGNVKASGVPWRGFSGQNGPYCQEECTSYVRQVDGEF